MTQTVSKKTRSELPNSGKFMISVPKVCHIFLFFIMLFVTAGAGYDR